MSDTMLRTQIMKAMMFATEKHKGQKRRFCDKPYVIHPKAVARILEKLGCSTLLIVAALLHDTLEDTDATYDELVDTFGVEVADLVFELSNRKPKSMSKHDYMVKKIQGLSFNALTIKLADRLHNILYLEFDRVDIKFVKKYYFETVAMMDVVTLSGELDPQYTLYNDIKSILRYIELRFDVMGEKYEN